MRKHTWLVFVVSLFVTLFLWREAYFSNLEISNARFHNRVNLITGKIQEAVRNNEKILLGCAGLFASTPTVTREIWRAYAEQLEMARTFPGIQGLGFGKRVFAADLASHIQSIQEEGFASYTVRPSGERPEYFPVIYLEPFRDMNLRAFGYDMFSEPVRRAAMERAGDDHKTTLTGKVTLVQEGTEGDIQSGFLMYHPVCTTVPASATIDQRRRTLLGYVYLPVRFRDFFDRLVFEENLLIGITVFAGEEMDAAHLVYSSTDRPSSEKIPPAFVPTFVEIVRMPLFGRVWTVKLISLPSYNGVMGFAKPWYILALGLFVSFFFILSSHFLTGRRDLQIANSLNLALQKARTELELHVEEQTADLKRTNRLLRLLSACAKVLIRAESETQLLDEMADLVIRVGGYRWCLVAFARNDAEQSLRPVVQRGFADGELKSITPIKNEPQCGNCPLRSAYRTQKPVTVHDVMQKPVCPLWCMEASKLGIGSLVALPLVSAGPPFGVIAIFSTQAGTFNPGELVILEEMSVDLAFGLETQRSRAARLRTEDELRRGKEKYRLLIDNLQAAIVVYSTASKVLFSNHHAAELLGMTSEMMLGRGIADNAAFFLRENRTPLPESEHPATMVLASGKPLQGLVLGISRPNIEKVTWMQVNAFPEFDDQHLVEQVVVTAMDITPLKLAEDELQAHRENLERIVTERTSRLEAIIHTAIDGIVIIAADGTVVSFNPAAEKIFGYQAAEIVGQNVCSLAPEPYRSQQDDLKRFLETGVPKVEGIAREVVGMRKDGSIFPIDLSVAEFSMAGNRMFNGIVRDISARKRAEDALKTAKNEALQASQAKSDFVANVSHEIRTPLNAIIGFANLALKTSLNQKQADYLGKIHLSGLILLGIINDLLDFSKIEAGKFTMESNEFCFEDVVGNLVAMVGPPATAKDLNIIIDVPVDFPKPLIGDALRLGQVLRNLLSNAVKFTEHGEIVLTASHRKLAEDSIELSVVVSDTGIGVTPEHLTKIFRPFTQADLSTTRRFGGTGLGLNISKRLIELMNGKIRIESEVGKGTSVTFTAVFGVGSQQPAAIVLPANLGDLRILVLETHPGMLGWFRRFFTQFSFTVDVVSSTREACDALAEKGRTVSYDLFLIDSQGIGNEVLTLLRDLRQNPDPWNHPKVILLLTSPMEDSLREQAISLEVREFLLRPVTPSSMVDAIINIFAPQIRRRVATSAQSADDLDLDGLSILVVEDNAMNQQIARELLESNGILVRVANNGLAAVELLMSEPQTALCDAILMDIQMPEMDGYEATRRIRQIPRYATTPIIAMTAHAMAEEREKVDASGMNDHVAKPIIPKDLFRTLRRWTKPGVRERNGLPSLKKNSPGDLLTGVQDFPQIPGVNVQSGLARLGGKVETYLRLLREFPKAQQGELQKIEQALSARDRGQARTLIHALKGLSGNLSLDDLFQAAGMLEKALPGVGRKDADDEPDWEKSARQFGILRNAFNRLSQAMDALDLSAADDPDGVSKGPPKEMPLPEAMVLLAELKTMLANSDPQARQGLDTLLARFESPADCVSDFQTLATAIGQFEFEHALKILVSIERKLESGR